MDIADLAAEMDRAGMVAQLPDGSMFPEASSRPLPVLYVQFTEGGTPAWIGPKPIDGSEPVEGFTLEFLVAHMRTPEGDWVPRPPPPPPTEAELAAYAQHLADAAAQAEANARERIEEEIARRAQPDALLRAMGKITIAELNLRVAAIRAEVETMG